MAAEFAYNLRFPGQYFDSETGKHYNYHRHYDPQIGRYSQPDPIGLIGGLNPFRYVSANPLTLTDPLGLAEICRKIIEESWRLRAEDWKVTGFQANSQSHSFEALFELLRELSHGGHIGFFGQQLIPISELIRLEQLYMQRVEVCTNTCTGEQSRRTLGADPTNTFRESPVVNAGTRQGDPIFVFVEPHTDMNTRWRNEMRR